MTLKSLRNILIGTALVGSLTACSNGNLRMKTEECLGDYAESYTKGPYFRLELYNQVTMRFGDTTLAFIDYTGKTVDWNRVDAKDDLENDIVDKILIKTPTFTEGITPLDSGSNTISGIRARDWLIKGNELYRKTRECFVDWARRDYQKKHPQSTILEKFSNQKRR